MMTQGSKNLQGAKNIGPVILRRLNDIGVYTLADLAALTSVQAYKRICAQNPGKTIPVCYYLFSLEGALLDLHWDDLPKRVKFSLRKQAGC